MNILFVQPLHAILIGIYFRITSRASVYAIIRFINKNKLIRWIVITYSEDHKNAIRAVSPFISYNQCVTTFAFVCVSVCMCLCFRRVEKVIVLYGGTACFLYFLSFLSLLWVIHLKGNFLTDTPSPPCVGR